MVWKARWLQFALATSTVAILAASAGAQDMTNRLMFGGSFGGMKVIPDSSGIKAKMGPFYGGRLSYGLSSKWLVFAGTAYVAGTGEAKDLLEGLVVYLTARQSYFESLQASHFARAQLLYVTGETGVD